MKVFIGWSGERSYATAQVFYNWLPQVIHAVKPFISSGIPKGKRWRAELAEELEETKIGILCLTRENLDANWILFEAGALSKTKDAHVCTFLLDVETDIKDPLALFQHTTFDKRDIRILMETIIKAVRDSDEIAPPEKDFDSIFAKFWPELETSLKEIVKKEPGKKETLQKKISRISKARPNCKALILAAGNSKRWNASIHHDEEDDYYSTLFWENVNKNLELKGLEVLGTPPEGMESHKSCAKLNSIPILQYSVLNYKCCGISDISVVVTAESPARQTILDYIDAWNRTNRLKIKPEDTSSGYEVAHSVYAALNKIRYRDERDIILSYSDIVWKKTLLEKLLEKKGGDIIILVDKDWKDKNYPERRIWHDACYAELIFSKEGKIEKIGEVVNRLNIPEWSPKENRVEKLDVSFSQEGCGEIIGIFKFSPDGRNFFVKEYAKILALAPESQNISVVPWDDPKILFTPKKEVIPIKEALLGCFLECLITKNNKEKVVDIEILEVNDGWAEIDHWGDICLAEERGIGLEVLLDFCD